MSGQSRAVDQANGSIYKSFSWVFSQAAWSMNLFRTTSPMLFWLSWINALIATTLPAVTALTVRGLVNALVDGSSRQIVFFWLLVGFLTTLLTVVTGSVFRHLIERMHVELGHRVQLDVLAHSAALPYAYFDNPDSRDQMQRADHAPEFHLSQLNRMALQFFTKSVQIASLFAILIAIEPIIFLLLLPIGIPYLIYQWRLAQRRFTEADERTQNRRWINYYGRLFSSEQNIAELKLLNLAPLLLSRVRRYMDDFRHIERRYQRHELIGMLTFALLSVIAIYLALARAVSDTMAGELTIGDIAIYGSATTQLRALVESLLILSGKMRWEVLHVIRIRQFLESPIQKLPLGTKLPAVHEGTISFEDVTFTYPGTIKPVLTGISFQLKAGETVALVGENGAGKTTIAKLISRFYDPDQGQISCNGVDLKELDPDYLRREIAFVLQHYNRYSATAAENLAFGDWQRLLNDQEAIAKLAEEADVLELIEEMPQGFDTMLGRTFGAYTPSGGEWQQLAIARALGRDAKILILDEPTASLDVRREHALFKQFQKMAQGRTTLLISHRFSTVRMADRILVIENGQIVENGSHGALMEQKGMYHALYKLHLSQVAR